MDFISEEFEAFKSSVNRMRWFLITSVIVSFLILSHIYLEQFSYQEHTLELIESHRIKNNTKKVQECRLSFYDFYKENKKFPDDCSKFTPELESKTKESKIKEEDANNVIEDYSETNFAMKRTDHAINNVEFGNKQIPLLGINVPSNDYINVMAMMLSFIVIGVWINLVGINASLIALKKHNEKQLIELARLNTLFISHLETESGQFLAKSVRLILIWLPFFSTSLTGTLSFWEIFDKLKLENDKLSYFGEMKYIGFNYLYLSLISIFHLCLAIENRHVIKDINKFFNEKN